MGGGGRPGSGQKAPFGARIGQNQPESAEFRGSWARWGPPRVPRVGPAGISGSRWGRSALESLSMALPQLTDLLAALGPSLAERFVTAHEAQARALTRLAELGELYLQVDPVSVARAMEAAQAAAANPGEILVDDPKPAELRHIEEVTVQLIQALGRVPTDEELEEELQRQEAVEAEAARQAQRYTTATGMV